MIEEKEKVYVAMSGGVDSSVAAALLVEQGYDVSGFMLKLWSCTSENACCPPEAISQAYHVAGMLHIPFQVIDASEVFREEIVDEFIDGYRKGTTPYPCYYCNRMIKWGVILEHLSISGTEKIATGHYARIKREGDNHLLLKAVDETKDQSYALSGLDNSLLARTIFPLGSLKKTQVRELAKQFKLPVAEKKDSQDLCFVGEEGYREFLRKESPGSFIPGIIKSINGQILGKHEGLANYTIGQRKGLGAGFAEPLYVLEKDPVNNEIVAGTKDQLGKNRFVAEMKNWSAAKNLMPNLRCEVKTRYKSTIINAIIENIDGSDVVVRLSQTQRDITPGQIAVFYQGEIVLGSAVIISADISGECT